VTKVNLEARMQFGAIEAQQISALDFGNAEASGLASLLQDNILLSEMNQAKMPIGDGHMRVSSQ